jgi:cobalamin biosynthesis Mg chelatase CobN
MNTSNMEIAADARRTAKTETHDRRAREQERDGTEQQTSPHYASQNTQPISTLCCDPNARPADTIYGRGSKSVDNVQERLFAEKEHVRIELVVSMTMMMNPERRSCQDTDDANAYSQGSAVSMTVSFEP